MTYPSAWDANEVATQIARDGRAIGTYASSQRPKVYLVDLAHGLGLSMRDLRPHLIAWRKAGSVDLQRADMPAAMDADRLRDSEIDDGVSTYHFIVAPPSAMARGEAAAIARVPPGNAPRLPRAGRVGAKRNPATAIDPGDDAIDLYRKFHRYDPRWVGEFDRPFTIPERVHRLGESAFVLYRSGKVDPETLRKPRKPVNYIHDHEDGVSTYDTRGQGDVDVPDWIRDVKALVLLGECLGFGWRADGIEAEAEVTAPLPELYAIPSGKALIVVEDKRSVAAIIWGGILDVEDRGIVG